MRILPIGSLVESAIDWLRINFASSFDALNEALLSVIHAFEWLFVGVWADQLRGLFGLRTAVAYDWVFTWMPFAVMLLIFTAIAWKLAGRMTAVFTVAGFLLIQSIGLWPTTMKTFALVATATGIALVIGIPLGIWMSRSNTVDGVVRPILDFMQTMPAFVYLIPAVFFFGLGPVPGAVATVIFAMPPVVRLTNLGIRQVPRDVVEACRAFGATSWQMLLKVQVPLAMPTIMAGLNQTIMLSLSMVVISSMIGAGGLGDIVLRGITQMKVGLGFEGGLAVVILAMVLDRITQGFGKAPKTQQ